MATDKTLHPHGAGSHAPLVDAQEMPACYPIKGDADSRLYHRPDSQNYGATIAEVWFDSPSAAEAAGFALAPRHSENGVSADYEPGGSRHPCSAETVNASRKAIEAGSGVVVAGLAPLGGGVSDVHPYGAGSHAPLADPLEMPVCYPIKGNIDSMLYHRPDSQNYGATIAEIWFDSPLAAEAAGFAFAPRHSNIGVSADYEPGGSRHPCAIAAVNANRSAVIGAAALKAGGSTTVDGDSSAGLGAGAGSNTAGSDAADLDTGELDLHVAAAAGDVDVDADRDSDEDVDAAVAASPDAGSGAAGLPSNDDGAWLAGYLRKWWLLLLLLGLVLLVGVLLA